MRGIFITFEGPEGSGKTTQAGYVCEKLEGMGLEVLRTREPGGTRTGEMIRKILQHNAAGEELAPESELLLFEASRAQLVQKVILPALEGGVCVVCDRFADSTTVYQGVARGFGVERIRAINEFAIGAAVPDLTLMLDVDAERGLERVSQRSADGKQSYDRFEREALSFHRQVRQGYLDLADAEPGRCTVISTEKLDPGTAAVEIWKRVEERIGARLRELVAESLI